MAIKCRRVISNNTSPGSLFKISIYNVFIAFFVFNSKRLKSHKMSTNRELLKSILVHLYIGILSSSWKKKKKNPLYTSIKRSSRDFIKDRKKKVPNSVHSVIAFLINRRENKVYSYLSVFMYTFILRNLGRIHKMQYR